MKKAHIGANGATPCLRRVSMHVRHSPPWVVSREKFLELSPAQQCAKCLARLKAQEVTPNAVGKPTPD